MKKLAIIAAIIFGCLLFKSTDAQVHFNIDLQPAWGPVGYDHADYYYLPDVDAYYDVPSHQFIYFENGSWVHRINLPARYRDYDLYNGYKVVINERNPWERHTVYRTRYIGFRGHRGQGFIRDSRDVRYRNHWNGRHDNGNRGNMRGNDNRGNRGHMNDNRGNRGRVNDNRNRGNQGRGHDNRGGRGNAGPGDRGHGHGN